MVVTTAQDPQDDPVATARKGLVSRKLLWSFILVFSAISIAAVVVAFQGKDPIAERKIAEEEKRRQQQVSQATGNPAELGKIMAEQARAGRAAKEERASRPSDEALAALTAAPQDRPAPPLDANSVLMPRASSPQVEAYRQRRDSVMAVSLPIYLDEREPKKGDTAAARQPGRSDQAASLAGLTARLQEYPPGIEPSRPYDSAPLYGAMAPGGPRLAGGPANEEWLRRTQQTRADEGPVFAQPALLPQHTLRRGAILPAVTVRGLTSELPGQLTVQVTQDIYDTASGENLLIPKGTLVVGPFNTNISENQARLFVAFQQLIYRNGATVNLPGMPGSDLAGYSGLPGEKDSHFWRIFGSSFLVAGLAKLLEPKNQSNNTVVINAGAGLSDTAGQILVETTRRMLERNQEIRPTITFGHGEKMNIEVTRDLVLLPEVTGIGR